MSGLAATDALARIGCELTCYDAGAGRQRFDWVVVATGHYSDPAVPGLPGEFSGTIVHARDYRTPHPFVGARVVVVGGAQSALDVVAEISSVAEHTILACDHVYDLLLPC